MRLVVGIDSAKDRVDMVSMVDGKVYACYSIDTPKEMIHDRSRSLQFMRDHAKDWIAITAYDRRAQHVDVFVEDAIMVNNKRVCVQLAHTVGMLLALPYRVQIVTIDSWKMVAIGKGGVNKAAVREGIVRRFPETDALYGKRQDLFDATGVAIYGGSVLRRR